MDKKKILYIVNPHSGVGKKSVIEKEIKQRTDRSSVEIDFVYTKYHGHAFELSSRYRDEVDCVVAVGGDGTVNETGSGLIGSSTALGIIPSGSGNGLARALNIPMRTNLATAIISDMNIKTIDVMRINDHYSLNVAGIGFDACISHLFASVKTRGPLQYMNLIAREFPQYVPREYTIRIDGRDYTRKAFLISFANSSQWGNNIHIAPQAQVDDGFIDVCIVSAFPNIAIPSLLLSLFNQSIEKNKYDEIIKAKQIEIENDQPLQGHVDGEPIIVAPHSKISVIPLALKVVVPHHDFLNRHKFSPANIKDLIQSTMPQLPFPKLKDIGNAYQSGIYTRKRKQ